MSKETTAPLHFNKTKQNSSFMHFFVESTLECGKLSLKKLKIKKKLRNSHFYRRLHLDRIQNDNQNIDGVDRFHQHPRDSQA